MRKLSASEVALQVHQIADLAEQALGSAEPKGAPVSPYLTGTNNWHSGLHPNTLRPAVADSFAALGALVFNERPGPIGNTLQRLERIRGMLGTRPIFLGFNLVQLPGEYPEPAQVAAGVVSPPEAIAQYIVELEEHLRWLTDSVIPHVPGA